MPPIRPLPPLSLLALALCLLALASCGSSRHSSGTTSAGDRPGASAEADAPPASATIDEPVATIGETAITRGTLQHWMAVGNNTINEVPEPPDFTACIERMRAKGSAGSATELKQACLKRYKQLMEPALSNLIHSRWVLAEADEERLKASPADERRELASAESLGAEFTHALKSTGRTVTDIKSAILVQLLTDKIYERVKQRTPRVTHARIASYYAQHKSSYEIPEERDLYIVHTSGDAAAKRARAEIQSGKSFQSVVKAVSVPQPIYTKEGLLRNFTRTSYSQPVLVDAIFKARPKTLSKPVRISLGYYVFEVLRVRPPHQRTLSEVEGEIAKKLPEELHERELKAFVKAFRKKWIARTDCRPDYTVALCSEYPDQKRSVPRDPFTF